MENITDYIKEAFAYKNDGDYKKAIDYFYKALAIDNESSEILSELANLYMLLFQYDRAIGLYEQILQKDSKNNEAKYNYVLLLIKTERYEKAETYLSELCADKYELLSSSEILFQIYEKKCEWDKTIELFLKNKNDLNSSKIYFIVGNAYKRKGNKTQADIFFEKAYSLDDKNINAGIEVANKYFENSHIEEAETLTLKLLEISENDKLFCLLGDIAYSKSDFDSAVKNYSFAIRLNDNNALYYFKLGLVYSVRGFYREAEECYCNALKHEPGDISYNYGLAFLYYSVKKFDLASNVLDLILQKDKNNPEAITLKILILLNENNIAAAGDHIQKANFNNNDDFSLYAQAQYYAKISMYDKAASLISKAIKINPSSVDYKMEYALYNYALSETDKAYEVCDEILKINDKYLSAYILQMKILYERKQFEKATDKIDKIKSLDKNNTEMYYIRGQISYLNGDYENASENFKTAVSIAPQNDEYYAMTGNCYYAMEQYDDAYYYFKEASEIDISNALYYYMMAKCAEKEGNNETAIAHFSVMKRLAPQNIDFLKDYAKFLYKYKGKKSATAMIKSSMGTADKQLKDELKKFLKEIK